MTIMWKRANIYNQCFLSHIHHFVWPRMSDADLYLKYFKKAELCVLARHVGHLALTVASLLVI